MMTDYIKLNKPFIDNFLSPLSNVTDKAPFHIAGSKISTSCKNPSGEITVSYSMDIDTNIDDKTINIPDIVKFKNLLDRATILDESDKLNIYDNIVSYVSSKWRFKYNLLDGAFLKYRAVKESAISQFDTKLSFNIHPSTLTDIVKLKSFHKNKVEKVYLKIIDGAVYACLTDETIANTDELSVLVSDNYTVSDDFDASKLVIKFDVIKLLSQHRGAPFKFKCSSKAFLIQTIWNKVNINYLTARLLK